MPRANFLVPRRSDSVTQAIHCKRVMKIAATVRGTALGRPATIAKLELGNVCPRETLVSRHRLSNLCWLDTGKGLSTFGPWINR